MIKDYKKISRMYQTFNFKKKSIICIHQHFSVKNCNICSVPFQIIQNNHFLKFDFYFKILKKTTEIKIFT